MGARAGDGLRLLGLLRSFDRAAERGDTDALVALFHADAEHRGLTTGRLVRGEVIKLKHFEFVEAARAVGVPQLLIVFRHILPNTLHILLVQATIVFVAAIKSEVILSFLGLGVQDGVSWGLMISESTIEVLAGFFNNFLAASALLFGLVMAFNLFSDALQDALDPRTVAN